jgi:hypothetical protein
LVAAGPKAFGISLRSFAGSSLQLEPFVSHCLEMKITNCFGRFLISLALQDTSVVNAVV